MLIGSIYSWVCFIAVRLFSIALLTSLGAAARADGPARLPDDPLFFSPPVSLSTRCGPLGGCALFDDISLKIGMIGVVRGKNDSRFAALSGLVHAAISFSDLAELGGAFGGHLTHDESGAFHSATMPALVYGRLRIYPWIWRTLSSAGGLQLAIAYQRSFVSEKLGAEEPPGTSTNRVSLLASRSFGPVDLDAGVAVEVGDNIRRAVMAHGSAALRLFGLARPIAPDEQLRVILQTAYRWPLPGDPSPADAYVLAGFEFLTHSGYRFGVVAGPYLLGSLVGGMGMVTFSVAWGPRYRNPLAEYIASKPPWIPKLWMDLFHVDPVLGPDGCIRTDPAPIYGNQIIKCVGQPAPNDSKTIVLPDGRRFPVGEHVWIRKDGMLVTQRQDELGQLDPEATKKAIVMQLLAHEWSKRNHTAECQKILQVTDYFQRLNIFAQAEAIAGLRGMQIADWQLRTEACGSGEDTLSGGGILPPAARLPMHGGLRPGPTSTGKNGGPAQGELRVDDILKNKKGSIKNAPLEKGSPSWEQVQNMTMSEIDSGAKANKPGYRTLRKLLTDSRFNK